MATIKNVFDGNITTPAGFTAGATYAGIKKQGENVLDLGMIYSQEPCTAAAVFTTNKIKSAALVFDQQVMQKKGKISAVIVNAGCANSSTGEQGVKDAYEMASLAAHALGIEPDEVLVSSTGVIGVQLPMKSIRDGVRNIILTADGGHEFEHAIMTTDTVPKEIAVKVTVGDTVFSIGGVAKGSGMIHPNLATMLVYITTDAAVEKEFLEKALKDAVAVSYNMISVDGDTSPSDTVLVLANGLAGNTPITSGSRAAKAFKDALTQVCIHLAKSIARDGEGATHLIEVNVKNAKTVKDARQAARTIVGSNLVKAAVYGRDPNWGRVTAALGRSGVYLEEMKLDVVMAGISVLKDGRPVPFDKPAAVNALAVKEVSIIVDMHAGKGNATAWGCDLTEEYVVINSAYTT
ncbi:MAG TPA: bifunctional glutamate N-acetyltransferase/amino-acid acetyltransferase ArgJ [Dehalococcoidales bacterium]|nr:bifunctional glutamate N-acetyltransferase/amino-acid acetyltransferase ArgJ [Dehalococcoidales bacterium]